MLDELTNFNETDLSEIKNPTASGSGGYDNFQKNHYQQQNNYQQNQQQPSGYFNQQQNNYQQNQQGYQKKQSNNFAKKEDVITDPYKPVAVYIDRDFPPEVKSHLISVISRLINKGFTVRYNADDPELHERISTLSTDKTEAYVPWKNFNNIQSKHYYNTKTANHVASTNFLGWEKVPDIIKAMLARQVRMVFGDKNNSVCMCLVTWSPDGASKGAEVNKETGRSSFIIKLAGDYGFPIVNLGKNGSISILERAFDI